MKILLPIDRSDTSRRVLDMVARRSIWLPEGTLVLLHVVDVDRLAYRMIPDFQVEMVAQKAKEVGRQLLSEQANRLRQTGLNVETRLESGAPRAVIPRLANEENFDLIVLGRRSSGEIRDVLFGTVTNHALHRVRCPVLLY